MSNQDKQDPVRDAAVAWAEVEYRHAASFTRSDLALTVNAWRASREATLLEVHEQIKRIHEELMGRFGGSYDISWMIALEEVDGEVEKMTGEEA